MGIYYRRNIADLVHSQCEVRMSFARCLQAKIVLVGDVDLPNRWGWTPPPIRDDVISKPLPLVELASNILLVSPGSKSKLFPYCPIMQLSLDIISLHLRLTWRIWTLSRAVVRSHQVLSLSLRI